ncbi:MAG TPA: agmatinase [Gemmatimonadales bacterium]|nr:agmatinase [Gemmatimonadales bacterium]
MHTQPPDNFLGLEPEFSDPRTAAVRILPVPYEATTSYGGGTRNGPAAIIEASRTVELYDHVDDSEPFRIGVATLPALALTGAGPEAAMRQLRRAYAEAVGRGKFVIALGGEHTISSPPILEWAARLRRMGRRLSVLQLDAHGDLRESWDGTPYSHACVMRRVADHVNLVQVGIRAIAPEERRLMRRRSDSITTIFAEEMDGTEMWIDRAIEALGRDVYITIDVDYFDPSLIPSTGTPEPGGGQWYPTLRLLERVFRQRRVVAADVVELAPAPGLHAPDFVVAKLVYKLVAWYGKHRRGARRKR